MPFIEGKTNGELRLRNDYSVLESEVMRSPIGIVVVVTDWWMWLRTDGFSFTQADVVSDGAKIVENVKLSFTMPRGKQSFGC